MILLETFIGALVLFVGMAAFVMVCLLWTEFWNWLIRDSRKYNKAEVGGTMLGVVCAFLLGYFFYLVSRSIGMAVLS